MAAWPNPGRPRLAGITVISTHSRPDSPVPTSRPSGHLRTPRDTAAAASSREAVSFLSAGQRCDGWLYLPVSSGPHACVVMAHGLGGIRSAVLPDIAQQFADAGIAALLFDYRHLGTSEGEPRGLIDSTKQRQDYRAAIAYARSLPGIDARRMAAWGTFFSGGHVLTVAADDPQLAAAVIQNPFVDGRAAVAATLRSAGRARTALLVGKRLRDQWRRLLGRDPYRVALAGPPGTTALMTTPDAVPGYAAILPDGPVGWSRRSPPASCCAWVRPPRPAGTAGALPAAGLRLRSRPARATVGGGPGRPSGAAWGAAPLPDRPLRPVHRPLAAAGGGRPGRLPAPHPPGRRVGSDKLVEAEATG
jgi:dienelactone hydrolase